MNNGSWILNLYDKIEQTISHFAGPNNTTLNVYTIHCKDPGWAKCKVRNSPDDFTIAWGLIEDEILDGIIENFVIGNNTGTLTTSNSYNGRNYSYQITWNFNDDGGGIQVIQDEL